MHGIISESDQIALYLERAKAMIDRPDKWLQNGWDDGSRRCAMQAIKEVAEHELSLSMRMATALFDSENEPESNVINYNDAQGRTHADMMSLFDNAITRLRSLSVLRTSV